MSGTYILGLLQKGQSDLLMILLDRVVEFWSCSIIELEAEHYNSNIPIHTYICTCTYVRTYICVRTYVRVRTRIHVHIYIHLD